MKLINRAQNAYVCYDIKIEAGQILEVSEKVAKILLNQPGIEQVAEAKKVEEPAEKDELAKAKEEATALGIKFNPNIGLKKLQEKIAEAKK